MGLASKILQQFGADSNHSTLCSSYLSGNYASAKTHLIPKKA